jgi:pimeloyl-ACP methyl ester carboxylesterase
MNHHKIIGGGGIQLHAIEAGNPKGRAVLFIHGFSQCSLAWGRQLNSDLANDHRLVALDIRGHGLSDKPLEGYDNSQLWADDLNAVITALGLDQPVLCGWSYGPLLILDYIRHYGEDNICGVHIVGGISKLGSEQAASVITPEFINLFPGFFSTQVEESIRGMESLLRMCLMQEPSSEELYLMLGYNLTVPPYVRKALFSRSVDNDDILPKIRKPVLITHGALDSVATPAIVDQHKALIPHAQTHLVHNAGHAPFWDDASSFNERLRAFARSLQRSVAGGG